LFERAGSLLATYSPSAPVAVKNWYVLETVREIFLPPSSMIWFLLIGAT
jgi:hypothetical protein